jgi:hypothetical protein
MSSRLTRALLKLYPRRIRNRYGEELLDLEDELRAQGEVSRTRLIRDMLAGALLIRPSRQRARLVTGAVLVVVGLVVADTVIGGRGTESPARASHPRVQLVAQTITAIPYGSCFVHRSIIGRGRCCPQQRAGHPAPTAPHGNSDDAAEDASSSGCHHT